MEWNDPPSPRPSGRNPKYLAEAAELRNNPGKWAVIDSWEKPEWPSRSLATHLSTGRLAAFRTNGNGEFEARLHADNGRLSLYARYLPQTENPPRALFRQEGDSTLLTEPPSCPVLITSTQAQHRNDVVINYRRRA